MLELLFHAFHNDHGELQAIVKIVLDVAPHVLARVRAWLHPQPRG